VAAGAGAGAAEEEVEEEFLGSFFCNKAMSSFLFEEEKNPPRRKEIDDMNNLVSSLSREMWRTELGRRQSRPLRGPDSLLSDSGFLGFQRGISAVRNQYICP
jgi:hypothetical protein